MQLGKTKKRLVMVAILLVCGSLLMAGTVSAKAATTGKTVKCPEPGETQRQAICPPPQSYEQSMCLVYNDCPASPKKSICQPEFDCPAAKPEKPGKGK
jgi:hypothetical protein